MTRLLFLLFLLSPFAGKAQETSAREVLYNMINAVKQSNTYTYRMKSWERFDSDLFFSESFVKHQAKPMKTYIRMIEPDKGIEILLVNGQYNGLALVNPNGFPFINVKLDPLGSRMRKNQHHTIFETGFEYMSDLMDQTAQAATQNGKFDSFYKVTGSKLFDGLDCYELVIDNLDYKIVNYTVKSNEDVIDIARKNFLSEYSILELNPGVKDYDDVDPGQVIRIPTSYSKKTVLLIDKVHWMPISQKMYDDKGLYEKYEFYELKSRAPLSDAEFDSEYKEYNF